MRRAVALLLLSVLAVGGCPSKRAPITASDAAHGSSAGPRLSVDKAGPRVAAAIGRGDYAEAATITDQTDLPRTEIDRAQGQIILDAQVDPGAKTQPPGSVEDGVRRIEAAALAGDSGAHAALRALFHTGLSDRGNNQKLAPDPALEQCWAAVGGGRQAAAGCVDKRRGH